MKRFRAHLIVVGLYVALTLALTWPLATHLNTHIPGSAVWAFDESTFVWNMWWFKFSLLDLGQSPLFSNYIFYPLGIDLVLYTFNFFNAMLGLPLQMVLPLPLASNLVILFTYVMSGYGTYLLGNYLLTKDGVYRLRGKNKPPEIKRSNRGRRVAAFVGGAVYAFAASRMIYVALGHYDMVTAQWFPFYALFLLKTLREPGYRNAVLAGLFAAMALLAEMIFGVFLLFLTLILLGFELCAAGRTGYPHDQESTSTSDRRWTAVLLRLVVLGLTVAILWSPVMVPILKSFSSEDFALAGWGESLKLSADAVGLISPTPLHPLLGAGDWPAHLRSVVEGNSPFVDVNTVFLGYGVLIFALFGAVSAWPRAKAWAWSSIVFAVFTLGPLLQVKGRYLFPLDNLLREQGLGQDVTFPLPFALLHYLPVIKANRVPNRFSIVLSLALAVLVVYGVSALIRRLPTKTPPGTCWLAGCLCLVFVLFDQVSTPLPLTDARVPKPYDVIATEPGNFAILQLPLGWRNSFGTRGSERTQLQYYQSKHHKHTLSGNISRAPQFKFDYFTGIPLFHALTETEMYRQVDEQTLNRAQTQAGQLMALYDVRYLVVHDPIPLRYPYVDTMPATRDLALSLLPVEPEPIASGDGTTVYRLIQPPLADPLRIDFGDWTSAPYRGSGWGDDEEIFAATANWAIQSQADVFLPVRGSGDRKLSIHIAPFAYPGSPSQVVTLSLNGHPLSANFRLADGWQIVSVWLPEDALYQGVNTLRLHFSQSAIPSSVMPGVPDDRTLAVAVDWIEIKSGRE